MCGRYTLVSKLKIIEKEFNADVSEIMDRFGLNPNIAPGDFGVVISSDEPKKAQLFNFGFTPQWASKKMYVINARCEGDHNQENDPRYTGARGIINKPMFRKSIRSQRCLVIADAFVEGTTKEKLNKPYLVYRMGNARPFSMAGIWDEWTDKTTGEIFRSFAILTTAPNSLMQRIPHHRSPLVLTQEQESIWIDENAELQDITSIMNPFDPEEFNAYPISAGIKNPKNKDLQILVPQGDTLISSQEIQFYQELELQGMGATTARKRRDGEQLNLFE
ncbi:MAG: SOS response-associated peptidase [Saprospiraceae bacterium]|nr:SOS response-associated peptidase [Saprospiraceae bacterium]